MIIKNLEGKVIHDSDDLRGADLSEAILRGAILRGANFSGANLSRADLSGAYLRGADLRGAYLGGANLRGAYLGGANLSGTDLREANLSRADLSRANLIGANLSRADLREADLSGADLREADLRGADLSGANLREANLSGANLRVADLRGADLSGADLSGADLGGADLSGSTGLLSQTDFMNQFRTDGEGYIVYKTFGEFFTYPSDWDIVEGKPITEVVNPNRTDACGCGVNFATLQWVIKQTRNLEIWMCRIEWKDLAGVVVPYGTNGKARCERLTPIKVFSRSDYNLQELLEKDWER